MLNLVLLPGVMCTEDLWAGMRADLERVGYLSFGDLTQDNSIAGMAERVLKAVPEKFVLIGFSMGGYVARAIAALAPRQVMALVLINTSARKPAAKEISRSRTVASLVRQTGFKGYSPEMLALAVHPVCRDRQKVLRRIQSMAMHLGGEVFLRQLEIDRDIPANPAGISCPTLVIATRDDRLRSLEESAELAAGIPGAVMRTIENCGHMTPMERPDELASIILDWLAELPLAATKFATQA